MAVLEDIMKAIQKYNRIIIHRHQRPDPDAIGSQVGLAEILRASFPYKEIFVVGKDIPGFDWIGQMDEIDSGLYENALVIVTDTANSPRIDDRRFNEGEMLVKIDHHPNDEPFGDVIWVNDQAASCSEMIYGFYQHFADKLKLPKSAANALYAGIVGDTGRFLYPATTPKTMLVSGALMAAGAQASAISRREDEITMPLAKLSAYVYENLKLTKHNAAYVVLTDEILKKFGLSEAETSAVVPLPGKIHEVSAWVIFVQQADGHFRVRLRSKGPAINGLAKNHRGGGHPMASGAKAKDDDEMKDIIAQLDVLCQQWQEKE
ncbi:bifunctional oligoribonuclease/PAP phosphatase NrnA [Limosilactobacillus sp.]|uniref:DHH family phosphoesterase n=1 Tax=Limosilactobacillus sp. TaxID=2773925 RepID=UPI00345F0388